MVYGRYLGREAAPLYRSNQGRRKVSSIEEAGALALAAPGLGLAPLGLQPRLSLHGVRPMQPTGAGASGCAGIVQVYSSLSHRMHGLMLQVPIYHRARSLSMYTALCRYSAGILITISSHAQAHATGTYIPQGTVTIST
jgi:hypothetical protein